MELKVICKRLITQNLDGNITEGEYGADVVGITVPRMYGNHDLSVFSFRLTAISKLNESVAEQVLIMDVVDDENIHLLWDVTSDFTVTSGEVTLILAGVNSDNTVQIKFTSRPVTINDDSRLEFIESPTILEQAYNQVQLEVQKAVNAAERAEEAASEPIIVPVATEDTTGGVVSGGDISITENGVVTVNSINGKTLGSSVPENAVFTDTVYTLPVASKARLGGIKSSDDITISSDGAVTVNSIGGKTVKTSVPQNAVFTDTVYTLPKATANMLGGVKVDNNSIIVNSNGVISATGFLGEHGETLSGNDSYTLSNSISYPVVDLSVYGSSTQDGTPTPESPVDIVSVGDDGAISVTSCGKNLINRPYYHQSGITVLGITYTVNDDGSVTVNGTTSNSTSGFLLNTNISYFEVGKTYTVSGTKGDVHVAVLFGGVTWQLDTFTITEEMMNADEISVRITVEANTTVNNVTIYPQLELGSTATEYEPYRGNTATITSGLPLCLVGEYRDELIYNADGTGKIIKRTAKLDSYNGEGITTDYISSTGGLDTGATVVYVLAEPQKIALSDAEVAELMQLQTFDGMTNIFNDESAEMSIKVATNPILSEFVNPVIDGLATRIKNLEAAVLSLGSNV